MIHSLRPGSHGGWSDYTKETLSELESVGMLTLIECAMNGGYDSSKGVFGTYNVPFLDGAMRRHLEASMGTLSLDRDSMGLVRKVQMLYHRDGKEMSEIAGELGVSLSEAAKAVAYPTHFSLSMTYRSRRRTEIFLSTSCLNCCLNLRRRLSFGRLRCSLCVSNSEACPSGSRIFWAGASALWVTQKRTCGRSPSETDCGRTAWRRRRNKR